MDKKYEIYETPIKILTLDSLIASLQELCVPGTDRIVFALNDEEAASVLFHLRNYRRLIYGDFKFNHD